MTIESYNVHINFKVNITFKCFKYIKKLNVVMVADFKAYNILVSIYILKPKKGKAKCKSFSSLGNIPLFFFRTIKK